MLVSLTVCDIVLIEKTELYFTPGLNVLTGETGAGKSILLDALGLATGARSGGRAGLRPGASQGSAVAVFVIRDAPHIQALVAEHGLGGEGTDELILRRVVTGDGRARAFVNDSPVGVGIAREIGTSLLEVHGQIDDRGLFDSATHRTLLDAYGGHAQLSEQTASLHDLYADSVRQRDALVEARSGAAAEIEYLTHATLELTQLAAEDGEEVRLATERALLMNAGKIVEDIDAVIGLLAGDGGAELNLGSALRRLSRMTPEGRTAAAQAESALETAAVHADEARRELEAVRARLGDEAGTLEAVEDRLFGLRAAARKYNVLPQRLPALCAELVARLALLDLGEAGIAAAEHRVGQAHGAFLERAGALSDARRRAAKRLEQAVAKELVPLKLGSARFRVALAPIPQSEAGAIGLERVLFEVATVEGASFGSLAKIASGGELSRFSLALKVALAEASPPAALVFDEIDRGVGGAVADAVGERLQHLAANTQVLLVTHSPQVAARARTHFRITRSGDATRVDLLAMEERVEEIARMLSGAAVTEEARAAARRLLSEATGRKPPLGKRARA